MLVWWNWNRKCQTAGKNTVGNCCRCQWLKLHLLLARLNIKNTRHLVPETNTNNYIPFALVQNHTFGHNETIFFFIAVFQMKAFLDFFFSLDFFSRCLLSNSCRLISGYITQCKGDPVVPIGSRNDLARPTVCSLRYFTFSLPHTKPDWCKLEVTKVQNFFSYFGLCG